MQTEIKITADGSSTLYVPALDEHYHSTMGAVQESEHVFIKMGLQHCLKQQIKLLEIGFGTGLNALLSLIHIPGKKQLKYTSIEKYPLSWAQVFNMGYPKHLRLDNELENQFEAMHKAEWEEEVTISENFKLKKQEISLLEFEANLHYDLVYFDAFAPDKQPEMWNEEVFQSLFDCMNNNGILVTYCAKGEVRRRMQRSGFEVERLPGPPGKREMLRATKNQ